MRRKDREVTNINEVEEIIKQCKTCHIAMVDNGVPYVVPLNFGYVLNENTLTLYFHSAHEGKKIDILHINNKVCFEMSYEGQPVHAATPCNSGYYFSSIIGYGNVEFVEEVNEKCNALSLLMKHQADRSVEFNEAQANSVCVFKIKSTDFTGKRKPMQNN